MNMPKWANDTLEALIAGFLEFCANATPGELLVAQITVVLSGILLSGAIIMSNVHAMKAARTEDDELNYDEKEVREW